MVVKLNILSSIDEVLIDWFAVIIINDTFLDLESTYL